jgi:toxin ParE1/3/4
MGQVIYSARSRADIADIWRDIALDGGEALADKKVDHIERRAAMLSRHPLMGLARPEIADGARSLLVERWLVLYRADSDAVRVMRVVDGARDLRQIKLDEAAG